MPVTSTRVAPSTAGRKRSAAQMGLPARFNPMNRIAVRVVQMSSNRRLPWEYSARGAAGSSRYLQAKNPNVNWAATKIMPMRTKVTANWWSSAAVAAEAPAGNHQAFARKKYVLAKVISQMTQRRTSPMYPDPLTHPNQSAFPLVRARRTDAAARERTEVYHSSM